MNRIIGHMLIIVGVLGIVGVATTIFDATRYISAESAFADVLMVTFFAGVIGLGCWAIDEMGR